MDTVQTTLSTRSGQFQIICDGSAGEKSPDFALVWGNVQGGSHVLVRIQSECITGHVLQSLSCDCYEQLQDSLSAITSSDKGILIYLRQEGRGIGLADKLRSYVLQKQGKDTVDANLLLGHRVDERNYDVAISIIKELGVRSIVLLTNNPEKVAALVRDEVDVVAVEPVPPVFREQNRRYLATKVSRMGHTFQIPD